MMKRAGGQSMKEKVKAKDLVILDLRKKLSGELLRF
jgi:hypothetical protein